MIYTTTLVVEGRMHCPARLCADPLMIYYSPGKYVPVKKIFHPTLKEIISINSYQIVFTLQG
jgi:hypothetical protein